MRFREEVGPFIEDDSRSILSKGNIQRFNEKIDSEKGYRIQNKANSQIRSLYSRKSGATLN